MHEIWNVTVYIHEWDERGEVQIAFGMAIAKA